MVYENDYLKENDYWNIYNLKIDIDSMSIVIESNLYKVGFGLSIQIHLLWKQSSVGLIAYEKI